MPAISANGVRHFYRLDGHPSNPAVLLAHSLGCDHSLWDSLALALLPNFRVLRYDLRGHGATDATPGDYTFAQLSADALALADALHLQRFAFCGLSMGGMIGQYLGAAAPARLTHLVLANTSARFPARDIIEQRRKIALESGTRSFLDAAMLRAFLPETLAANPPFVGTTRHILSATNPVGYAGCCAALRDLDQVDLLPRISVPTLVIAGDRDISTPWTNLPDPLCQGDQLARQIPGAKSLILPTAHLSILERPAEFSGAVRDFLTA